MDNRATPLLFPDALPTNDIVSWTRVARDLKSRQLQNRKRLQEAARNALAANLPSEHLARLGDSNHAIDDGLTLLGVAVLRDLRIVVCNPGDAIALEIVPEMLLGGACRQLAPIPLIISGRFEITKDNCDPDSLEIRYSGSPIYIFRHELRKALPVSPKALRAAAAEIIEATRDKGGKIKCAEFKDEILKRQPFASKRGIENLWKDVPSEFKHDGRPSEVLE